MYSIERWKNRAVEFPRRYRETQEKNGAVTHAMEQGEVVERGTPFDAEHMNNMETGIMGVSLFCAMLAQAMMLERADREINA